MMENLNNIGYNYIYKRFRPKYPMIENLNNIGFTYIYKHFRPKYPKWYYSIDSYDI